MSAVTIVSSNRGARHGLTLLEVLVACGLLIIGLSTMAALLPAAGFRLAQAHIEDQASVLASNALAEALNRRLAATDAISSSGSVSVLAFGEVLGTLPTLGLLPSGRTAAEHFAALSPTASARCGSPRTFLLEDDLLYTPPGDADSPANAFVSESLGSGPRGCKDGVCWGGTLRLNKLPPIAGDVATLTTAVFRKRNDLAAPIPVVLTRSSGFYEADITPSGSLLRACRWVIAVPSSPARQAEWFQIMSSWTLATPAPQTTRLIMQNQPSFEDLTGAAVSGAAATILAFDGLVRIDQRHVTLH